MAKKVKVDKLIKQNPQVDKGEFNRARSAISELRKAGIKPEGYRLTPPFRSGSVKHLKNKKSVSI